MRNHLEEKKTSVEVNCWSQDNISKHVMCTVRPNIFGGQAYRIQKLTRNIYTFFHTVYCFMFHIYVFSANYMHY